MNKRMICLIPVAGILLALSSGCTSVRGVKPIQPKFGAKVDSLQPLLEWKEDKNSDGTYDLTITEKAPKGMSVKNKYYKEGIKGTSHQVEKSLKPDTRYTWALRSRKGDQTGEWNKHETALFLLVYFQHNSKPFEFKTP